MWGYQAELERTMVVGPASDRQRRFFEHMKAVQEVAFDALRPGSRCSDVDRAVRRYYADHDLTPYWKHHTGHGIGLDMPEPPRVEPGVTTPVRLGMALVLHPALRVPGVGGAFVGGTVLIDQDGPLPIHTIPEGQP